MFRAFAANCALREGFLVSLKRESAEFADDPTHAEIERACTMFLGVLDRRIQLVALARQLPKRSSLKKRRISESRSRNLVKLRTLLGPFPRPGRPRTANYAARIGLGGRRPFVHRKHPESLETLKLLDFVREQTGDWHFTELGILLEAKIGGGNADQWSRRLREVQRRRTRRTSPSIKRAARPWLFRAPSKK